MPLPTISTEKPSTSETAEHTTSATSSYPGNDKSVPAADVSDQASKVGATGGPAIGEGKASAEEAAERLYEERIEGEYAKREGGA